MKPPPIKRPLGVLKSNSVNLGTRAQDVQDAHAKHHGAPKHFTRKELMIMAKERVKS